MVRRIEGVSERLLNVAKQAFLDNGFLNASLRVIAIKADTSTRAIYTRFNDKQGLFCALVEPVFEEFIVILEKNLREEWKYFDGYVHRKEAINVYIEPIRFIYENLDEFKLLINHSAGTIYADFVEKVSAINEDLLEEKLFKHCTRYIGN